MSLLQNRFVVGGLVVVALGALGYSVGQPYLKMRWGRAARPAVQPAAVPPAQPAASAAPAAAATPPAEVVEAGRKARIDQDSVLASVTSWLEAPRRDPFQSLAKKVTTLSSGEKPKTAAEVLTVTGIWRQTGHDLAVINRVIVHEGDQIGEYTLLEVTPESIRVRGPLGDERVGFGLGAGGMTNIAPVSPKQG